MVGWLVGWLVGCPLSTVTLPGAPSSYMFCSVELVACYLCQTANQSWKERSSEQQNDSAGSSTVAITHTRSSPPARTSRPPRLQTRLCSGWVGQRPHGSRRRRRRRESPQPMRAQRPRAARAPRRTCAGVFGVCVDGVGSAQHKRSKALLKTAWHARSVPVPPPPPLSHPSRKNTVDVVVVQEALQKEERLLHAGRSRW